MSDSEGICERLNVLASAQGCSEWPIENCLAPDAGPQNVPACVPVFHALLDCVEANSELCGCQVGNELTCDAATDAGGPCETESLALIECGEAAQGP